MLSAGINMTDEFELMPKELGEAIQSLRAAGIDLKVFAGEYEAACKSTASDAEVKVSMQRVRAHAPACPGIAEVLVADDRTGSPTSTDAGSGTSRPWQGIMQALGGRLSATIISAKRKLCEFASVPVELGCVLSADAPGEQIVFISPLAAFFDEGLLRERLPWAGELLRIAKTRTEADLNSADYAVFIEPMHAAECQGAGMSIVLVAPGGLQATAELDSRSTAAFFDLPLPWDPTGVEVTIMLRELPGGERSSSNEADPPRI